MGLDLLFFQHAEELRTLGHASFFLRDRPQTRPHPPRLSAWLRPHVPPPIACVQRQRCDSVANRGRSSMAPMVSLHLSSAMSFLACAEIFFTLAPHMSQLQRALSAHPSLWTCWMQRVCSSKTFTLAPHMSQLKRKTVVFSWRKARPLLQRAFPIKDGLQPEREGCDWRRATSSPAVRSMRFFLKRLWVTMC